MKEMKQIYAEKLLSKGFLVLESSSENCVLSDVECSKIFKSLNDSFNSLGYEISAEDISLLKRSTLIGIHKFYEANFKLLSKSKGEDVDHIVFYKSFPDMENIQIDEYVLRALLHYMTATEEEYGYLAQDTEDFERVELHSEEKITLRLINGEQAEKLLLEEARAMFEEKIAIPLSEEKFLREIFSDYPGQISPASIPFKENIGRYLKLLSLHKDIDEVLNTESLKFIDTATDFLRVYAVLSGSSATLKERVIFTSLKRSTRVVFLKILDDIAKNKECYTELKKREFLFKRAFEKLHIGEYSKEFPAIFEAVYNFRSDNYLTFNSRLEALLDEPEEYLKLLATRPGEFARKLDHMLRSYRFNNGSVLSYFDEIKENISSKVLIELWEFFTNRKREEFRVFPIKSQYYTKYYYCDDNRVKIDDATKAGVVQRIEEALSHIYKKKDHIEKVYLDEKLKNYPVPRSNRNASATTFFMPIGTRLKLDLSGESFLRIFTHWKNKAERTDIDLSLELFTEDLKEGTSLAWHSMHNGRDFSSYHSGDIITAPKGASEFIDLDYVAASKKYRYIAIVNTVFTKQDFCDIDECFTGIIPLDKIGKKGKIFNPEFVRYKFDLKQRNCSQNVIFMVDLIRMELIYLDIPIYGRYIVAGKNVSISKAIADASKKKMSLYKLFTLHREHLSFVDNAEEAEFIISDDNSADLQPKDIEKISSNWL